MATTEGRRPPKVAKGKVIPLSRVKLLGMILMAAFFFLLCGFMLWDRWWHAEGEEVLPFRLTWWGTALAGVGFVICLFGLIVLPFELLFPPRLVLGPDVFQVVRAGMSGDRVEVQIPYANMKAVEYEKPDADGSWQVGISLYDEDDPDTYEQYGNIGGGKKAGGRDFTLENQYTVGLEEIARLIRKKRKQARDAEREEDGD